MNGARIRWTWLGMQVLERRAHLALSLRVTIAALLAFEISNMMSLRLPLWTVLTAIILTQANFGRSVKATLDYLVGTVGGPSTPAPFRCWFPITVNCRSRASWRSPWPPWPSSERSIRALAQPRSRARWCCSFRGSRMSARSNSRLTASWKSRSEEARPWRCRFWCSRRAPIRMRSKPRRVRSI